jgi:alcohol dehydrogenase (cytochrome c)
VIKTNLNSATKSFKKPMLHGLLWWTLLVLCHSPALAQNPAGYNADQAAQGEIVYEEQCAVCHGYNLEGFDFVPSLSGNFFSRRWGNRPIADLAASLQRMPPTQPGALSQHVYSQLLAFLLQRNGAQSISAPLAMAELAGLTIPAQTLLATALNPKDPSYDTNGPLVQESRLNSMTTVTDLMLANPSADDWLIWRRTHESLGHSPLTQINLDNVSDLETAWTWALPSGANMMTPLVHDGVLFAYSNGDVVQALDGATGDLLWSYQRDLDTDVQPSSKKGVAIYEDKIIVATSDVHLLALDAKTGRLIWDHEIETSGEIDFQIKSAPMVVNGKAIIGMTGQTAVSGGNFIVAIDLDSSEEVWRFYTIARPDEPGGNTWNNLSLEDRTGGSVWNPGSYDPQLNLVYFGPAPTYDTNSLRVKSGVTGMTSDALYTNSTIALNAETGELVWHYQHMANDQLDHDWAYERQLINLPVNGVMRRAIVTGGKEAIFEALDAATGDYLFSIDLDMQNVIAEIDPRTGKKTLNQQAVPKPDQVLDALSLDGICPNALGARNMQSASYNPITGILYIPMQDTCINNLTGQRWQKYPDQTSDGLYGMVKAVDLKTHEVIWTQRQFAPPASGNLTTDSGLLFSGSVDRYFRAIDQTDGSVLWQRRLDNSPSSYPITYRVDGRQYVAVATNSGSFLANSMERTAGINNPPTGATLWVFALPSNSTN